MTSDDHMPILTRQSTLLDASHVLGPGTPVVLVADDDGTLAGTVGDAELREAVLRGLKHAESRI